jgi:integrase
MPRRATGTLYQNPPNSGIFYVQLTLGKTHLGKPKRRSFALPLCKNEAAAQERMELLAGLARRLRDAGREDLVEEMVDRAASAEGRALDETMRTAELIIAGKLAGMPKDADPIPTIRQLGTLWTSGELHKQFPDHIKKKSTADDDAGRLEKHVYPVIGEIPIDAFTLDHANLVMAGIPAGRAPATRRHIAQLLHRICAMALFPLRLIKTNPLPEGFLPPIPTGKAKSWLYPDEDAKLLSAKPVPLAWRVFYGFLHREGPRISEAVRLRWSDLDLERGAITLDKNKTNDPRAWALSRGVVLGMRAFRIVRLRQGILVGPGDLVFTDERGKKISNCHQADRYREHLATAGIERANLFERTKVRQPVRIHDTRATFITIALANGKSEAWVQDRTGHKSSQMINRYRRAARTAAELDLGNLAPMYRAIPELARLVPEQKATIKATPSPITTLLGLLNPQQIQASSPSRTRTGTSSRTRDFKGNKGISNRRQPRKRRRSGNASRRFAQATDDSDPSADDSVSADKPTMAKDLRAPSEGVKAGSGVVVSTRMALVTRLLEEQLAAAKAGDEEAVRVLHEAVGRLVKGYVC